MKSSKLMMTIALLKLAKRLKQQFDQLEESGVRILQLEQAELDSVNLILLANDVHKNDGMAAWIIEPLMQYIDDDIGMNECLRELHGRIEKSRRERINQQQGEPAEAT
ncbi:hypothetical protein [Cohnella fermenti]|uniref:Uncharacterized protein n=1 Tax=Cohnella fermenti TaxID=2565925 RepID=A0A4S4C7U1_9BACL|nr:hypothetical protein [Cohnella fermenti]THF83714.1 hypothetical protein E6C55_03215 [Cohnella fermenti]